MQLTLKSAQSEATDIAVVGGGPAGLAAALSLAAAGASVALFAPEGGRDPRTTALLGPSVELLRGLGVWEECAAKAAPLKRLVIIDRTGRLLRAPDAIFDAAEAGFEAFGYNVPNEDLVATLRGRALGEPRITALSRQAAALRLEAGCAFVRTKDGGEWRAQLVAGADGRGSICREAAGVRARSWAYDHAAVACSLEHTAPHRGVCVELHGPAGPFTLVPLPGNRSSLVWVERPEEAARLKQLGEADFSRAVEARAGEFIGDVSGVGPRALFPLSGLAVDAYAARRVALVGEAAHVVPPIGAQGLNLGFRDAAALAACVTAAIEEGRDVGGAQTLADYNRARRGDVLTRTLAADILNRTLISGFPGFQAGRAAALAALGAAGPLRRFLMRRGMGLDAAG